VARAGPPGRAGGQALSLLPQTLERLAETREALPDGRAEPAGERRGGRGATVAALALAMVALALLATEISDPGTVSAWPGLEPLAAVAFLVCGGLLLRAVGRR
jgi:hypothetical protein